MTALLVVVVACLPVGFVAGFVYEQKRIYAPVEVPLDCGDGGGGQYQPTLPQ